MSILINGMKMPKNCMLCNFCVEEADPANGEMCLVTGKLMPPCNHERLEDCPLIEVPAWIPVTERLPKEVGWYLVVVLAPFKQVRMYEFYPVHNNYGNDLWRNNDGDHVSNWFVTHWMPLPKPPKDGET